MKKYLRYEYEIISSSLVITKNSKDIANTPRTSTPNQNSETI